MGAYTLERRQVDLEFFAREIAGFLPNRIFDAHAHLAPAVELDDGSRAELSLARYRDYVTWLHGDRPTDALCIGEVPTSDTGAANAYVAQEAGRDRRCAAHFLVRPTDDPEWVRGEVRRLGMRGIKPFHAFVREPIGATMQCDIPEWLPEPLMQVAHEEGWSVTMHLVKSRGIADPGNQYWIARYARAYPHARLLLCHVARAWNPAHAFEGLPPLATLDNVWLCTDLNGSAMASAAAFKFFPRDRIVYGTDFWWSHLRGLCTYAGDGFLWIQESNFDFASGMLGGAPTLVGLEHLRAVKWAAWITGLSDPEIENYFHGNAQRLLEG
jgi:hypothetical protein